MFTHGCSVAQMSETCKNEQEEERVSCEFGDTGIWCDSWYSDTLQFNTVQLDTTNNILHHDATHTLYITTCMKDLLTVNHKLKEGFLSS